MNMKKTMAAIAAGAVAVSAMATTVSAETIPTKTLKYNLVRTVKQPNSSSVKLTAKFYNVPLEDASNAVFTVKSLGNNDIVRISGVYIEEGKQIVPIVITKDKGQSGVYSAATEALITATDTITVPVRATNADRGAALMGGSAGVAGTPAGLEQNATVTNTGANKIATDPVIVAVGGQAKLNEKATDNMTITCKDPSSSGKTDGSGATWDVVVGTAAAVNKSTAEMASEYGLTVSAAASNADDNKSFTVSKYVAATPAVDATPANEVHANITVEVTKKGLSSITANATDWAGPLDLGDKIDNVNAELASGAAAKLGVGLVVDNAEMADFSVAPQNADVTASDFSKEVKVYKYPYQSSLNNTIGYTIAGEPSELAYGTAASHGGDVLNHIWEAKEDDDSKQISPVSVRAVINDAIQKHGEVTFTFNTAALPVKVASSTWFETSTPLGAYVSSDHNWAGDNEGCLPCTQFGNHFFNAYQAGYDPNTSYIINEWKPDNLFTGALLVNSNLTLSLSDTAKFDWTDTSLSFTWEGIQDSALTQNQYANYIQNMVLRTSSVWYWDNLEVVLGETEVEEVESGAPVEGDVEDLPEDEEEETDLGGFEAEEEEEEEEESEPEPEVAPAVETNPGTGNAPVALAVIPVALAAAAIVAKKRG